ncbi:MAG: hypothetical protein AAGA75_07570 [Cyanobacteria bacterium P01_E01_bin.6]
MTDTGAPKEGLQSTIFRIYNKNIREWFRDLRDIPTSDLDLQVPRQAALSACTHADDDSMVVTLARMLLFNELRGRFTTQETGITNRSPTVIRRTKPQVLLFFQEDNGDIEEGFQPVTGRIAFRLMDETTDTMTNAKAIALANRVKTEFNGASEQIWRKGRMMVTYADWERGYQLQLLCRDLPEGKNIIGKILDLQNHTPNWEYLNYSQNDEPSQAFPPLPPTDSILGEVRRLPRRRPIANVRFQYAILNLHGLPSPVCLVDRSTTWPNPLVEW